jgi:exodeoxyribonuclease-3
MSRKISKKEKEYSEKENNKGSLNFISLFFVGMKVLSWNVNGIRAVVKKWFIEAIQLFDPDIICLQETKAFFDQCPEEVKQLWYDICWHAGTRPGYAGTAILTKNIPHVACSIFPHSIFHEDGRVTQVEFGNTLVLNIYFPNGGVRADGTEMLSYKLNFYDTLIQYIQDHKDKNIIIVWDYNICHTEFDIARPKENVNSIGFLPIERAKVSEFLSHGFVDVYRHLYPDARDEYTWRSYRAWAKQNNVWRRIDYACVSDNVKDKITRFKHFPETYGSDHCPIMLEIDL